MALRSPLLRRPPGPLFAGTALVKVVSGVPVTGPQRSFSAFILLDFSEYLVRLSTLILETFTSRGFVVARFCSFPPVSVAVPYSLCGLVFFSAIHLL